VSFTTIFKGVIPFVVTDLIRLVILISFPIIALWLPSKMG
jgi:TRAP-type mannitol/chloroaromatic compound transport system permease large subunit